MNNQLTKQTAAPVAVQTKPSALNAMAARLSVDPLKLLATLKATVFKGASDDELLALAVVANEYNLNPFLREIYAFPKKGGGIVPMVPIDGWTKIVTRQPNFDGVEFDLVSDDAGKPLHCTCKMHIKGRSYPVVVTEYLEECYRNTEPWNGMPRRMIRHKAFMQAGRLAFALTGISDEDEAIDVTEMRNITPVPETVDFKAGTITKTEALPAAEEPAQTTLANVVTEAGFTFDHFKTWADSTGVVPGADSLGSFEEISSEVCKRILRAKAGMLSGLALAKGGAK